MSRYYLFYYFKNLFVMNTFGFGVIDLCEGWLSLSEFILDEVKTPEKRHQADVMEGFEIRQIASEGEIITEEEGIETKIESIILYQGSVQEELK